MPWHFHFYNETRRGDSTDVVEEGEQDDDAVAIIMLLISMEAELLLGDESTGLSSCSVSSTRCPPVSSIFMLASSDTFIKEDELDGDKVVVLLDVLSGDSTATVHVVVSILSTFESSLVNEECDKGVTASLT